MEQKFNECGRRRTAIASASPRDDRGPEAPNTRFKRILDICIASVALVFVAPLLITVMILIRLQDGGPALYSQSRYGRGGKTFKCYKLRSMVTNAKEQLEFILATDPVAREEWQTSQKLTDDPRITPLGHFIRKTSIDELPQLFNILCGDMSLVGPRPIVENEIQRYGTDFKEYCAVRPGLTGLWQVRGRSDTTYGERVALDVEYANSRTLMSDIVILFQTIPAVIFSRGAR